MNAWLDKENLEKAEDWVDEPGRQGKPLFDDPEVPDLAIYQTINVGSAEFEQKEKSCIGGGGAARIKFEAALFVEGGVQVIAAMARARLGVEVVLLNAEARASAELLKTGVGREVYLGIDSLSGSILAYLDVLTITCSGGGGCTGHKCHRVGGWRWSRTVCVCNRWQPPTCTREWERKFSQTLWGWSSPKDLNTGNLACRVPNTMDLCRDWGHNCCANPTWDDKPKCRSGYVPKMENPAHAGQCTNPACFDDQQARRF